MSHENFNQPESFLFLYFLSCQPALLLLVPASRHRLCNHHHIHGGHDHHHSGDDDVSDEDDDFRKLMLTIVGKQSRQIYLDKVWKNVILFHGAAAGSSK